MMDCRVLTANDSAAGTISLSEDFIGQNFNEALIHQVVVASANKVRSGTKAQKTRSEVSGGGRKPWRQKGTGRARAGTIRSPLWRHGGRTFAAKPRNYEQKVNRKMYRGAMRSIFSELLRQERLQVVESFGAFIKEPKTKVCIDFLQKHFDKYANAKILLVSSEFDENLFLSSRNIINVNCVVASAVNPLMLVNADVVIFAQDAIKKLEGELL